MLAQSGLASSTNVPAPFYRFPPEKRHHDPGVRVPAPISPVYVFHPLLPSSFLHTPGQHLRGPVRQQRGKGESKIVVPVLTRSRAKEGWKAKEVHKLLEAVVNGSRWMYVRARM